MAEIVDAFVVEVEIFKHPVISLAWQKRLLASSQFQLHYYAVSPQI
jgi:hypothetical protein